MSSTLGSIAESYLTAFKTEIANIQSALDELESFVQQNGDFTFDQNNIEQAFQLISRFDEKVSGVKQ